MGLLTDLISVWELNEASGNALDSHGSNTLTETSGTIGPGASGPGGAGPGGVLASRDFEAGDTEFFDLADNASISTGDIDFTFSAWINAESLPTATILAHRTSASSNYGYYLFFTSATNRFVWRVGDGAASVIGDVTANTFGAPSTATWYHIVCWHDAAANQVGISINAGTPDTAATTGAAGESSAHFTIGATITGGIPWDGLIAQVAFWKRVLTSQERTDLYAAGSGLPYSSWGGGGASAVGSADGTSTAAAVGAALDLAVGFAGGASFAAAEGTALNQAVGAADGTSTATAVGEMSDLSVGVSVADSTATAVGASTGQGVGQADGTSTVFGSAGAVMPVVGSADGTSTVTGFAQAVSSAVGFVEAAGHATAFSASPFEAVGVADGVCEVAAWAGADTAAGEASGTSTVTAGAAVAPTGGGIPWLAVGWIIKC